MNDIKAYFQQLSTACGNGWTRFWFTSRDAFTLSTLRILTGLAALYFVASFSTDLIRWFGPNGILNATTASQLTGSDQLDFRVSYLYLAQTPGWLWTLHIAGLLVLLLFTLGLWSRVMNVAGLVVVLSYVHRGPILAAQFEPVLTMLLAYLCIGSTGRYLSLDAWLARRRQHGTNSTPHRSIASNIATRLIQLHLAGLCLTIGLNMLAGEVWWSGEALWWLIARTESRLVDLTGLSHTFLIVNVWTHSVVAYQLAFGLLAWNRLARPLLLLLGVLVWISLAAVTGLVAWCTIMLVASLAFVEPEQMQRRLGRTAT